MVLVKISGVLFVLVQRVLSRLVEVSEQFLLLYTWSFLGSALGLDSRGQPK